MIGYHTDPVSMNSVFVKSDGHSFTSRKLSVWRFNRNKVISGHWLMGTFMEWNATGCPDESPWIHICSTSSFNLPPASFQRYLLNGLKDLHSVSNFLKSVYWILSKHICTNLKFDFWPSCLFDSSTHWLHSTWLLTGDCHFNYWLATIPCMYVKLIQSLFNCILIYVNVMQMYSGPFRFSL